MERDARQRIRSGAVLAAVGAILPPLAVFAPLGAAPLMVVASLAVLALDWRRIWIALPPLRELSFLLAALGLWGTASGLWSILPQHSFVEGVRFLAESAAGLVLLAATLATTPSERQWIRIGSATGVAIAICLIAVERFGDAWITRHTFRLAAGEVVPLERFDRSITVLVFAAWPVLAFAKRGWGIALVVAVAALSLFMVSAAALLAFATSVVAYGVARIAPRLAAATMFAGVVLLSIALPLATPSFDETVKLHQSARWIKDSGIHRLLIWRFTADRIAERPLLGWGMDASRELPGGHEDLSKTLPGLNFNYSITAISLHPHSAALQWWVELGLPGLGLGWAIIGWGLWRVGFRSTLPSAGRAGALAWAAAGLIVAMLSFGIWQAWWLATLWLTSALYAAGVDDAQRGSGGAMLSPSPERV